MNASPAEALKQAKQVELYKVARSQDFAPRRGIFPNQQQHERERFKPASATADYSQLVGATHVWDRRRDQPSPAAVSDLTAKTAAANLLEKLTTALSGPSPVAPAHRATTDTEGLAAVSAALAPLGAGGAAAGLGDLRPGLSKLIAALTSHQQEVGAAPLKKLPIASAWTMAGPATHASSGIARAAPPAPIARPAPVGPAAPPSLPARRTLMRKEIHGTPAPAPPLQVMLSGDLIMDGHAVGHIVANHIANSATLPPSSVPDTTRV